jgi:hypothetical protein
VGSHLSAAHRSAPSSLEWSPGHGVVVGAEPWWHMTWGGHWSHGMGWSSERPPGWCTTGAELRHRMVTGVVTDGDREREEKTRCGADRERERERRGLKQVRRHSGDFFVLACCLKFHPRVGVCSKFFFVAAGYVSQYKKNISLFFVAADYVNRYEK